MMMSGSGMGRYLSCIGSCVLPRVDKEGTPANRGKAIHKFIENVIEGMPRDAALEIVPEEYRVTCRSINTELLPRGSTEVTYVYDVQTGKANRIGRHVERKYVVGDYEVPCTVDLETYSENGPYVVDFKTGFNPVEPADHNPQLLFSALCLSRITGASSIGAAIVYVHTDGELRWDRTVYDAITLDTFAARVRNQFFAAMDATKCYDETGEVITKIGKHCTYCESKRHCVSYERAANALISDAKESWAEKLRRQKSRRVLYLETERAKAILEIAEEMIREDLRQNGEIDLGDGRIVLIGKGNRNGKSFDRVKVKIK